MKLIDLDALREEIENGKDKPKTYDGAGEVDWIDDCMEKAPVAYDVDKVLEQLEEFRQEMEQFGCGCILSDIIEVVNGGGVDE